MTPRLRKAALTAHIASSVGWLGAVASFLALSMVGLNGRNSETVRAAYLSMNLIGQYTIVPLSLAALLSGLVQSLGTEWGLARHYWVLAKFALTMGATLLLVLHQFTAVAGAAGLVSRSPAGMLPDVGGLGMQLVFDASAALVVLLVIMILSVYKPGGRTSYGQLKQRQEMGEPLGSDNKSAGKPRPMGFKIFLVVVGLIGATFIVLHLTGYCHMSHSY